jgi:tetratricopeptide (TPR) repeat protein
MACVAGIAVVFCMVLDSALVWGQRGGRGGGGGARAGGGARGGGVSRPSGGGISRPSGGAISRPSGGAISRPSGGAISRPAGGVGGGINRSPGISAPKVSPPIANRPNLPGGGAGVGSRPGVIQGPGLTPGTRPDIGIGKGVGGGINSGIGKGVDPGFGKGIGGGINSGIGKGIGGSGIGNRPGFDPGSGFGKVDPKYGVRPGQRPSTLPGLGIGAGVGAGAGWLANRDGPGRRQENIQDRRENLTQRSDNMRDRMQDRQDFWNQSQQDRQDFLNNRREDWQNWAGDYYRQHDYWFDGYWNCDGWWDNMWDDHPVAMILGTTAWGINRMNYWFGTDSYWNPYYTAQVPVGETFIDYSVPLAVPPADPGVVADQPPGVTDPGMKAFAEAQAAFYEGNYQAALDATNKALVSMPKDAIIHEFRALVLFALGNYRESAQALHPVLAVGPGWDWKTMTSLYPNIATYEPQLRKLEEYVNKNYEMAHGRFVLGYHYTTLMHKEAAAKQFREVCKLTPGDTVSAQILAGLESKGDGPVAPKGPPSTAKIDNDQLIGSWAATRGKASFVLTLDKDKGFTWSYTEDKKKEEVKGAYALDGTTLSMEPDAGGIMLAEISAPKDGAFTFQVVGAPKSDKGLSFKRK